MIFINFELEFGFLRTFRSGGLAWPLGQSWPIGLVAICWAQIY